MAAIKVGYIVGSIRKDSLNRKLAQALAKLAPSDFSFEEIGIANLPLYSQELDGAFPESIKQFKSHIQSMDAILFASPEYNRSISGVLKNAIDIASRPYGESVWGGKPAGVIGASVGAQGTSMSQQHLRNVLAHLDMPTLNQPEVFVHVKEGLFDDQGNFGEAHVKFYQKWMDHFVVWVKKHRAA